MFLNCLALGDISPGEYHSTITWRYATASWARHSDTLSNHLIRHRHYRLVLNVIGHVLVEYRSSYEMVSAVRDGLIGRFPKIASAELIYMIFSPQGGIQGRDFTPGL